MKKYNNTFELEFANIAQTIKTPINSSTEKELKRSLLKLNNPNFYNKFTRNHPMSDFGYYKHKTINPILISIRNMLSILKEEGDYDSKTDKLQIEVAWAYHEYQKYSGLFKKVNSDALVN